MSEKPGIWFVYRSHYEGPLSRRVRRIEAPSIVAWFRERFQDARVAEAPHDVGEADLGGYVYGFGTIFEAVKEHKLVAPTTMSGLEKLLQEHLYVEGGRENIRVSNHTLRVTTDDDEVHLAYFFFDDEAVAKYPDRLSYLLLEDPKLPDGEAEGAFEPPFELDPLLPGGKDRGNTYACLFTFYDGQSLPGEVHVFPGVRLPDLCAHLRQVTPTSKPESWSAEWLDTWPIEMRLLRAMVDPEDRTVEAALTRAAAYPIESVAARMNHSHLGIGSYKDARGEFEKAAEGKEHGGDPSRSIVHVGKHVAVLCAHESKHFGYQQWILFDDRWAAAHPALAASMLRYGRSWDPFYKPTKSPEEVAAQKAERAWKDAIGDRDEGAARAYRISERFTVGELLNHKKFGLGVVKSLVDGKIEVLFKDGARVLASGG